MKLRYIKLTQAAVIGALYAALTLILAPISFGAFQIRVSEALAVLPIFTSAAIPGLFIGCAVANIAGGLGIADIIFGSIATLISAFLTYKLRRRPVLALLPPVLINALVVGLYLKLIYFPEISVFITIGQVAAGQIAACYAFGLLLHRVLKKYEGRLFG